MKAGAVDREFETMYAELKAWRDAYGTTLVPKQVTASHFASEQAAHSEYMLRP